MYLHSSGIVRRGRMGRFMVDFKSAGIFKGIFEMQKSTRNGKNNAKIRALVTWHPRVYHAVIKHTGEACGVCGLLRCCESARLRRGLRHGVRLRIQGGVSKRGAGKGGVGMVRYSRWPMPTGVAVLPGCAGDARTIHGETLPLSDPFADYLWIELQTVKLSSWAMSGRILSDLRTHTCHSAADAATLRGTYRLGAAIRASLTVSQEVHAARNFLPQTFVCNKLQALFEIGHGGSIVAQLM
jgi:hypothetical protein